VGVVVDDDGRSSFESWARARQRVFLRSAHLLTGISTGLRTYFRRHS